MNTITLGSRTITDGPDTRPYIIAEIGVNHGGSMERARELIELAKQGGADAAKFQTYKAATLASRHSPSYWDTTKEPTTSQYELFKKYDSFGREDYIALAEHCRKTGIDFLSTPFDDDAIEFLNPLMPFYKIASADLTNTPFLRKVAGRQKARGAFRGRFHAGRSPCCGEGTRKPRLRKPRIASLHPQLSHCL